MLTGVNFNGVFLLNRRRRRNPRNGTVNKYIRPGIIENVKNGPELREFRKNKITLDYNYFDKNGEFVTQISVTPEMYSKQ
jgi:hypothetical protein